jgi:probable F420-dependent oxidoreductase
LTTAAALPFWLDRPPQEAIEIATSAEALGYDELWVGEMATFDAFALAGAIARETRTLRLVVGPLALGVRSPVSLALGVQSIAILGGRPADLALGASNPGIVEGWHGRQWRPVAGRLRETVAALRPILAGERADFDGRHVHTHGFRLRETSQPVTLAVAAFGSMMLRAAAELADRVVLNLVTPEQVRRVRADLDRFAHDAGRPPPPLTVWVPVARDPSEAALRQLAGQIAVYLPAPGYSEMFEAAGFGEIVDSARKARDRRKIVERIPLALPAAIGAIGDAGVIADRLSEFGVAGADVVAIIPATADDPDGSAALRLAQRTPAG